jgi:hypothetical protein
MDNWINFSLLSPANIMVVGLVLVLLAYGAFVITNNLPALTPSLQVVKQV